MFAFWKHETPCVGRTKRRRMRKLDALEDLLIERGEGSVSVFERDKKDRREEKWISNFGKRKRKICVI